MASQKKVKQESGKGAGNALEKLAALHNDVEELSNELSKEAEKLELLFDKKREAIFERRLALLKEVPEFWITAIQNHRMLSALISERELPLLQSISDIRVRQVGKDRLEAITVTLTFGPNNHLDQTTVVKELTFSEDPSSEASVVSHPIKWKAGKDLTAPAESSGKGKKRAVDEDDAPGFFKLFSETDADATDAVIRALKEVSTNAFKYYIGEVDDSDDEELEGMDFSDMDEDDEEDDE